jgi:hypothetical protein
MAQTMMCPRCGRPMNFHALRERDPHTSEEARRAEALGGRILEEFHTCASCHITESRSA